MVFDYRCFRSVSTFYASGIFVGSTFAAAWFRPPFYHFEQAATVFGLDAAWFDTHSLRMSAPTIARAANVLTTTIMSMGRWKLLPASLLYQAQSTQLNNSILSIVNNTTLFTIHQHQVSDDFCSSRCNLFLICYVHLCTR